MLRCGSLLSRWSCIDGGNDRGLDELLAALSNKSAAEMTRYGCKRLLLAAIADVNFLTLKALSFFLKIAIAWDESDQLADFS